MIVIVIIDHVVVMLVWSQRDGLARALVSRRCNKLFASGTVGVNVGWVHERNCGSNT
jgi:hypothetical protein